MSEVAEKQLGTLVCALHEATIVRYLPQVAAALTLAGIDFSGSGVENDEDAEEDVQFVIDFDIEDKVLDDIVSFADDGQLSAFRIIADVHQGPIGLCFNGMKNLALELDAKTAPAL